MFRTAHALSDTSRFIGTHSFRNCILVISIRICSPVLHLDIEASKIVAQCIYIVIQFLNYRLSSNELYILILKLPQFFDEVFLQNVRVRWDMPCYYRARAKTPKATLFLIGLVLNIIYIS